MNTTYSFLDTVVVLAHSLLPIPVTLNGEGLGKVTISMTTERSSHNVAADGVIMVTKRAGNNGMVSIDIQQTSAAHKELLSFFNALIVGAPSVWAQATLTVRNVTDGTTHVCTGLSPQKVPDKNYEREGGMVSWVFLSTDIQNLPV